MKKEETAPYCNQPWWLRRFEQDRVAEAAFLSRWHIEAGSLLQPKRHHRERGDTDWWALTGLLVAWCDYHPDIRVDPSPFQEFLRQVWKSFDRPRAPRPREVPGAVMDALQRLHFSNEVWRSRRAETLNDVERKIAAYIDKHPGCKARAIADAIGETPVNVRGCLGPTSKLYILGYRKRGKMGPGSEGYFGPGV